MKALFVSADCIDNEGSEIRGGDGSGIDDFLPGGRFESRALWS